MSPSTYCRCSISLLDINSYKNWNRRPRSVFAEFSVWHSLILFTTIGRECGLAGGKFTPSKTDISKPTMNEKCLHLVGLPGFVSIRHLREKLPMQFNQTKTTSWVRLKMVQSYGMRCAGGMKYFSGTAKMKRQCMNQRIQNLCLTWCSQVSWCSSSLRSFQREGS